MLIAIDGNEANTHEKVGVSHYTYHLLKYFQNKANQDLNFIVFLRNKANEEMPPENQFYKYELVPGRFLWSQFFLPLRLYQKKILGDKIDVFFSPAHYSPRFCPVPLVVTIHDLAYFYYPDEFLKKDLYKLSHWTKHSVFKAKKVIGVSKNTKKDLMKFYNLPDEKIDVVYNGFDKKLMPDKNIIKKVLTHYSLQTTNYILFVGTLQPRKNLGVLIEAFKKLIDKEKDWRLVIVGKKGWMYDKIYQKVIELNIQDKVIFTGYLPDIEVAALYSQAYCYILPSLYEGFGIPILEAMSYDCPVITSFASSLPEVCGEACLYLTPDDPDDVVQEIMALKDDKLRNEMIQKGQEKIKEFSWAKCAEETLKVIKSVI